MSPSATAMVMTESDAIAQAETRGAIEPERPAVFFLPRHPTSWVRMLDQARVLRDSGSFTPVMVLATAAMAKMAETCRAEGLTFVDATGEIERRRLEAAPRQHGWGERLETWAQRRDRLGCLLPLSLLRLVHLRRRLRAEYAEFRALCERWQPVAILVPGDRELSPVPPMLRAALDLEIPSVIAFSGVPDPAGAAGLRRHDKRFRLDLRSLPPLLNFYAARRYPRQVCDSRFGRMLFSPGWLVLALASLDMLSANPWIQGGGNSRYILQNSKRRMRHFIERGVPESKHVFVGDLTLEPLHAAKHERESVRKRLTSSAASKLVVMSVPNDAEHNACDWPTHLARMAAFMRPLAESGAQVVLSLHPKSKAEDYRALAERFGFRFADRPLVEILPAADLFVCSGSSTVLWANLVEVPAINLDYLDVGNFENRAVPGVTSVRTAAAFAAALEQALHGMTAEARQALADYAAEMREDSLFDGRAGARFCAFLETLAAQAPSAQQQAKVRRIA